MPVQRKIIHIDCDCFFAAVEMRDNPALLGRPIAVGGSVASRGVLATCNYEARRFGLHSAMPTREALKRCPDLVLIAPRFSAYRAASQAVQRIFADYTELIEPLSLDEAYLDVSASPHCQGSATRIAQLIRARIRTEVGITASAGIAPNKFVAKIASDWRKPDGQFVVLPHEVDTFVAALPVGKLYGVGPVTAGKLNSLGAQRCADMRGWPLAHLSQHFGRFGERLYELCRGIDLRPVCVEQARKSLSVETTYAQDLVDLNACQNALLALIADFERRLQACVDAPIPHKAFIKIRFANFSQTTVECLCNQPTPDIWAQLLMQGWQRGQKAVRLLGLGVRFNDAPTAPVQLSLFESG